jgi:hypothetical protein
VSAEQRVRGFWVRDELGALVFVVRRERRVEGEPAWHPEPASVAVQIAVERDIPSALAAQRAAVALWAAEVACRGSREPLLDDREEDDADVLDLLELGTAPSSDPLEVPDGAA